MANKLTTLGYFLKRLRDSGYYAYKLYDDYSNSDSRLWTIVIDPKVSSIFCTCFSCDANFGDDDPYLELSDGGQYLPIRLKIKTMSFEILIENLVKYGINNKTPEYNKRGIINK